MKKLLSNQKGVTLIETLAATVIIVLLLFTLLGSLVFGQKVIVGSDEKNRAAAEAQEMTDVLMKKLSLNGSYKSELLDNAKNMGSAFDEDQKKTASRQYYILPIDKEGKSCLEESASAYKVYVRVYYNQGEAFVDLSAYAKKGGVGD